MARGGSRTKSGPAKNPSSRTSERAGFSLTALPSEGFTGRTPGLNQFIPKPTVRQRAHWDELWSTPQACAWSRERWRWSQIARLCQLRARAEDPDAAAAIYSEVIKLEAKHGLSDDGMRYLGWAIAKDEVAAKAATKQGTAETPKRERRLRSVGAQ